MLRKCSGLLLFTTTKTSLKPRQQQQQELQQDRVAASPQTQTPPSGSVSTKYEVRQRRKWEERLSAVLLENKERRIDKTTQRFERYYVNKDFTKVDDAFPLDDPTRWAGMLPAKQRQVRTQPKDAKVVKVAVLGPPNAGKSSLMNALVTSHVSAQSSKEGTTKDWVKGVCSVKDTQMVFLDTPGIFQIRKPKDRSTMLHHTYAAFDSLFSADCALLVHSVGLGYIESHHKSAIQQVASRASMRELPLFVAFTKMDELRTQRAKDLYVSLRAEFESLRLPVAHTFEVSARTFSGVLDLKDRLMLSAKKAPWAHYRHESTDLNDAQRMSQLITEAFHALLPHKIPHVMTHKIVGWTKNEEDKSVEVAVEVYFDRPTFMYTFYGKMEAICLRVRMDAERIFKTKVFVVFQAFVAPGGIRT